MTNKKMKLGLGRRKLLVQIGEPEVAIYFRCYLVLQFYQKKALIMSFFKIGLHKTSNLCSLISLNFILIQIWGVYWVCEKKTKDLFFKVCVLIKNYIICSWMEIK